MPDGSERPVAFVSRTLSAVEKSYSQIENESLACAFGVKRFHSYIFGHIFELVTDHKPLITIFNERKPIPTQAAPRILRWALTLATYEYTIRFKSTQEHCNADGLSRLPLSTVGDDQGITPLPPEYILLLDYVEKSPITWKQIAGWTSKSPQLTQLMQWVRHGWPLQISNEVDSALHPFKSRRQELTVLDG